MTLPLHIIVADDTDSVRGLIVRVVARTYPSVRISAVADGQDALAVFDNEGADLIITNNAMRTMDGITLINLLRARPSHVPIVMISGDPGIESQALAAGANGFLSKPFSMQGLMQMLLGLLNTTP